MLHDYNPTKISPPDEPETLIQCESCECNLYEGEPVYKVNGMILCEKCLKDMYKIDIDLWR